MTQEIQAQFHRSGKIIACSNCTSCFPGVDATTKHWTTKGPLFIGNMTDKPQILVILGSAVDKLSGPNLPRFDDIEMQSSEGLKMFQQVDFHIGLDAAGLRLILKKNPHYEYEHFLEECIVVHSIKCRISDAPYPLDNMNVSCSVWTKQMISSMNLAGIICVGRPALDQVIGFTGDSPLEPFQMKKHPLYGPLLFLPSLYESTLPGNLETAASVSAEFYAKVTK